MTSCGLRSLKREFSRYKGHDELQRSMEERAPRTPTPSFASCISDSCNCQQSSQPPEAAPATYNAPVTGGRSPVPENRCCLNVIIILSYELASIRLGRKAILEAIELMERISCSIGTSWKSFQMLYKTVSSDRFTWQLFKSIIFFTLGLKLFNDIARHMAKNNK
ncbi:hypothetical protein RR48_11998 [Papilio machaon]|uniref:Uncharacterized protein n=1 Tax=Papilio machaon TaxID=76193 RepID=A0A194RLF7_PAPMA|nr:hypothetical protein RR48_11998 [Papilio machaon]